MKPTGKKTARPVLMPTDFEMASRRAFAYAVKLAGVTGARLEILHVIKTVGDSGSTAPDRPHLNSLKTAALLELGRLTRVAREAGVSADPSLRFGVPDACILEAVGQLHPEMIVMGTEGRTGWDRLRLGSTAETVVREATCPVLAVHGGLAGDAPHHHARVKVERLLLATDFSSCAEEARRALCVLAQRTNGSIRVVHAAADEPAVKRGKRRMNGLLEDLRRNHPEAEGLCLPGEPLETILSQAAQWRADVIVVGTQGRRGLSRLLLGSVAEGLLRRAGCPVLVVRRAAPLVRSGDARERRRER